MVQCDKSTDRAICIADCERSRVTLQESVIKALADCTDKPCNEDATCTLDVQKRCTALAAAKDVTDSYCAKKKGCEATTDTAACAADFAPSVSCFSTAGLDKMSRCIKSATCGDLDQSIGTCMRS